MLSEGYGKYEIKCYGSSKFSFDPCSLIHLCIFNQIFKCQILHRTNEPRQCQRKILDRAIAIKCIRYWLTQILSRNYFFNILTCEYIMVLSTPFIESNICLPNATITMDITCVAIFEISKIFFKTVKVSCLKCSNYNSESKECGLEQYANLFWHAKCDWPDATGSFLNISYLLCSYTIHYYTLAFLNTIQYFNNIQFDTNLAYTIMCSLFYVLYELYIIVATFTSTQFSYKWRISLYYRIQVCYIFI